MTVAGRTAAMGQGISRILMQAESAMPFYWIEYVIITN
jgi:hypothetical protein